MMQCRKSLAILTRKRLLEVSERLEIGGLTGKTKDQIIESIAAKRSVKVGQLLGLLRLEELKTTCLKAGLDGGGRSKSELIARLLKYKIGSQGMAKKSENGKRKIEQYDHKDKTRANNPPVGLVTPKTDPDLGQQDLSVRSAPRSAACLGGQGRARQLRGAHRLAARPRTDRSEDHHPGGAEAERRCGNRPRASGCRGRFSRTPEENPPLREAVDFYKHAHGWSNRLVAGDSLVVMNSLLEKEGMAGKVQMVYIDPPYGIKYGTNFQPFVNKRDVKDGKDSDLTQEPEMILAFRDTWELGVHSYLTYLRDRMLLARELLTETGSVFVQINDENVHHVRELMDEVFGSQNFCRS